MRCDWMLTAFIMLGLALPARAQAPDAAYRAFFAPPVADASESLRLGWGMHYRGAMPGSAFAIANLPNGQYAWASSSGQADAPAAETAAIAACGRQSQSSTVSCRILARDGVMPGRGAITSSGAVIGPLRASPLHFVHGPTQARGVVVWSHGRGIAPGGGGDLDSRGSPSHGWVSLLNDTGWDILRFDRAPGTDDLESSTRSLQTALPLLRQAGYRQIVLAGQSRGGWQSLAVAARAPDQVHAVLAVAPAMHGADGRFQNGALDDWRRLVAALPAGGPRLAATLFRDDRFDPLPSARVERWEGRARERQAPSLLLHPSTGPGDHAGGAHWTFTRDWAPCLARFVNDAAPPSGTKREPC
jgi:pimeloyl-ACP methyl ester carboxylesterase